MLLEAQNVGRDFGGFRALTDASLNVEQGEIVGLIGPNGAGKSTFFNCIAGDLAPTSGQIRFAGLDVTGLSAQRHASLGIGRTFQVPATFEDMTVLENVMVGAFLHHPRRSDAQAKAIEILRLTELEPQSGVLARSLGTPGRKRLEIARVLAIEPKLLLLDEALAGLTPSEIQRAIALVRRIHALGITIVIVEQSAAVALAVADYGYVLENGRVVLDGDRARLLSHGDIQEFYLGHTSGDRRSYRSVKQYRRSRRWYG